MELGKFSLCFIFYYDSHAFLSLSLSHFMLPFFCTPPPPPPQFTTLVRISSMLLFHFMISFKSQRDDVAIVKSRGEKRCKFVALLPAPFRHLHPTNTGHVFVFHKKQVPLSHQVDSFFNSHSTKRHHPLIKFCADSIMECRAFADDVSRLETREDQKRLNFKFIYFWFLKLTKDHQIKFSPAE